MIGRLASKIFIDALFRKAGAAGGFGTVIHRGNDAAGGILIMTRDRGAAQALIERSYDHGGRPFWRPVGPDDEGREAYIATRRGSDRDLWVVELDVPDAARLAAEMLGGD